MTFMCRTTTITTSSSVVPVTYFGRIKVFGNRTFADWTVTIINDEDFVVRNAMKDAMNVLIHIV